MIETLLTPADFAALPGRDLSRTTCVVFDVLRATSAMLTALAHGAETIIPVADIPEALAAKAAHPEAMLAGERDGVRIRRDLTGSVDFDFGNSPREFVEAKVRGRSLIWTTTNGTRALRACASAARVLIGGFLNLGVLAQWLRQHEPTEVVVVCSGTYEQAAYEDILAAGALCDLLATPDGRWSDSSWVAWKAYQHAQTETSPQASLRPEPRTVVPNGLAGPRLFQDVARCSRNARRLLDRAELAADVAFCLERDRLELVAHLDADGVVRVQKAGQKPRVTAPTRQ